MLIKFVVWQAKCIATARFYLKWKGSIPVRYATSRSPKLNKMDGALDLLIFCFDVLYVGKFPFFFFRERVVKYFYQKNTCFFLSEPNILISAE